MISTGKEIKKMSHRFFQGGTDKEQMLALFSPVMETRLKSFLERTEGGGLSRVGDVTQNKVE